MSGTCTAFSPTDIASLQLWLDGNDTATLFTNSNCTTPVASFGDGVGCWKDKSGQHNDATQSTSGSRPLYSSNSAWSEVKFNTGLDMDFPSLSLYNASIFLVYKYNSPTDYPVLWNGDNTNSGEGLILRANGGNNYFYYQNASAQGWAGCAPDAYNSKRIAEVVSSNSATNIYFNGVQQTLLDFSSHAVSTHLQHIGNSSYVNGFEVLDLLIYNTALSDSDRQKVESYLLSKYP